jgi:hypothetical protein
MFRQTLAISHHTERPLPIIQWRTFTKPEAVILFVTTDIYGKVKIRRLKCILMMRKQNKNLYPNYYKKVCVFEKKYFHNLALKRLVLYVNLLGPYVAYSYPLNLVYK